MEDVTNNDRGFWALCAVEAYAGETRMDPREQVIDGAKVEAGDPDHKAHAEELISDLLGDIRHLCDQFGIDWDTVDDRGADHYLAEKEEEKAHG